MLCTVALEDGDWVVKASVKLPCESAMVRSRMRPSETMSRFCSGSLMPLNASRTVCSVTIPGTIQEPRTLSTQSPGQPVAYLRGKPCTPVLDLLQKASDFSRRIPSCPEPFCLRRDRHHRLRSVRPPHR